VDIDEASLKAIGQWPWPRTQLARLVEGAAAAGALAIGLDIMMPEADRFSPAQLVAQHPNLDDAVRDQRAKEREARLAQAEVAPEDEVPKTAAAVQKTQHEKMLELLNRLHKRA
jgi:CHASE2 domain-containing sensor protein